MGSQPCPCAHSLLQAQCEDQSCRTKWGFVAQKLLIGLQLLCQHLLPGEGRSLPRTQGATCLGSFGTLMTRNSAVPAQGQHKRRSRRTSSSVLGCPSPSDTATKSVPCQKNRLHSGWSWGGGCQRCRGLQRQCLLQLRGGERSRAPLAQGGSRGLGGGGGAWAPVSGLYHTGQPRAGWPLIINPGPGP